MSYEPDHITLRWVPDLGWFARGREGRHDAGSSEIEGCPLSCVRRFGEHEGDAAVIACSTIYPDARIEILRDDRVFVTRPLDDRHASDLRLCYPRVADYAGDAVQVSWDQPHRLDDRIVHVCPTWGIYDPTWGGLPFGEVRRRAARLIADRRAHAELHPPRRRRGQR